jgi:hypothetical protein
MKIGLDLDGVCFNFTDALYSYAVHHQLIEPSASRIASTWDWFKHEWGWESGEFAERMTDAIEFWDLYARPGLVYPGVVEGVAELRRQGHTIHIITDRARFGPPGMAAEQTYRWLDAEGVEFDTVTFAQHKAAVLRADVAFDDAPHHWRAYQDAGAVCVLRDHPYNQDCEPALRTPTFDGFVTLVNSLDHRIDLSTIAALYAQSESTKGAA